MIVLSSSSFFSFFISLSFHLFIISLFSHLFFSQGASVLVLMSKMDLPDALSESELRALFGPHHTLRRADCRSGEGVRPAVEWLVRDIAARIFV